jgi:hypothetical protein
MLEADFQTRVLKRFQKSHGGVWIKYHGSQYSQSGVSDLLICHRGRFVAIELKQPGKYTPSATGMNEQQTKFVNDVEVAGGVSGCADSYIEVQAILDRADTDADRTVRDAAIGARFRAYVKGLKARTDAKDILNFIEHGGDYG